MSRSIKKEPVYKDPNNSQGKRTANRKLRRKTKQSIHQEDDVMPMLNEVEDSRNFLDFKKIGYGKDKEEVNRLKRK